MVKRAQVYRTAGSVEPPPGHGPGTHDGRKLIAAIGINAYDPWPPLDNAVNDARSVLAAFKDLGFQSIVDPLFDGAATREAIDRLDIDLRARVRYDDSLVVFFAGHGYTTTWKYPDPDRLAVTRGYLIPADAKLPDKNADRWESLASWQRLDHWLSKIAELPARHVLVILDSCRSGIALSREVMHRELDESSEPLADELGGRRSRRVITSSLGTQDAMDGGGPIPGHSVFAGFLIDALRGGASQRLGDAPSGAEMGYYLRRRVKEFSGDQQIPATGLLELDARGELLLSLCSRSSPSFTVSSAAQLRHGDRRGGARPPRVASRGPAQMGHPGHEDGGATCIESWALDAGFATMLDIHGDQRKQGGHVLSVIAGDAMATQTAWATWAARRGYLTLVTDAHNLDAAVADLLAQTPWLRCIHEARKHLAAAAGIPVLAVDATLDSKAGRERRQWVQDVAALNPHALVSGWLLTELRKPRGCLLDVTTAPVTGARLLSIACDLAAPTAVLMLHSQPDVNWFERAVGAAANLITYMPGHSVAVTAPDELVTNVLRDGWPCAALTMARQGLVRMTAPAQRLPGRARRGAIRVLFEELARDSRTRGHFVLDGRIRTTRDGPPIEADLVAHRARIAVELDGWYHFRDAEGYRRDRIQDSRLARAGYFVLRFPAEDVDGRLVSTIDHIAIALAGRHASVVPY